LPEVPFKSGVESLLNAWEREARSLDPGSPWPVEACSRYHGFLVAGIGTHPVLAAAHLAFNDHRPLVLSPDIIWLLLAQGFANHVNANAEGLRHQFVKHSGKLRIEVRRDDFIKRSPENPWPEVVGELTDRVREHIGDATHDLLLPAFSTTGPVERAAAQIVLLDAVQSYFSYCCITMCGIPQIVLEGASDDWQSLVDRTQTLARFGLEWWTESLAPILGEFVAATRGKISRRFWQSIYKFDSRSGEPSITTGWITAFFPYLMDRGTARATVKNRWLEDGGKRLENLLYPPESAPGWRRKTFVEAASIEADLSEGPDSEAFPTGVAKAPFVWNYLDQEYEMELLGGFVGVAQDAGTLALRPEIGWVVRDIALIRSLEATEKAAATEHGAAFEKERRESAEATRRAKEHVVAPRLDPAKPRHAQFFQFVCPFCAHEEAIGLWFSHKTCSRCGKGCPIVRERLP
jgi:hypothetical protein